MKDLEIVKEYLDKLLGIVNKIRLQGTEFKDSRIVENFSVTPPERYEACITNYLGNTRRSVQDYLGRVVKFFSGTGAKETL